jgi:NAD(P)-dependent dehydrogenase (short-subunit alcohol dehydrogenase family)
METVALVTGSTNNIGKGIAETLSRDGFLVIVTSRHENEAKEVADHLPAKGAYYQVDFSDAGQIAGLFSFIKKSYGRLDVLVNSVAHTENESILGCTLETWERTINTNLRSYYLCTRYAAEIMRECGGGNIVNITVGGGEGGGGKNKFAYTVSKGGVNSLTKCAAAWPPSIFELMQYLSAQRVLRWAAKSIPTGSAVMQALRLLQDILEIRRTSPTRYLSWYLIRPVISMAPSSR